MAYIEFSFPNPEQFKKLRLVFDLLRDAKKSGDFPDDDYWLRFFDEQSRSKFWWPVKEEAEAALIKWRLSDHDPSIIPSWTFGSMIGAIKAGEYELVACKQVDDNTGRLEYEPLAWPYGGEGCLHMLIQAFECVVTEEDVL